MSEWIKELIKQHGESLPDDVNELYAEACEKMQKAKDENTKMWEDFDAMFEKDKS